MKEYEIVAKFCNACAGESRPETYFDEIELPTRTKKGWKFLGWAIVDENGEESEELITEIEYGTSGNLTLAPVFGELMIRVAESFDTSKDYVLGMYQGNKKQTLYMTGQLSGYYGATTTDFAKAAKLNVVETNGGYYLKLTLTNGSVKYICLIIFFPVISLIGLTLIVTGFDYMAFWLLPLSILIATVISYTTYKNQLKKENIEIKTNEKNIAIRKKLINMEALNKFRNRKLCYYVFNSSYLFNTSLLNSCIFQYNRYLQVFFHGQNFISIRNSRRSRERILQNKKCNS